MNMSGWKPLLDANFQSVTPIGIGDDAQLPDGTLYFGGVTTNASDAERITTVDYGDDVEQPGYQTDFIWYRGLQLATDDPDVPGGKSHSSIHNSDAD